MKYGMRNAAPPNSATRYGNSQMLPMPTAEPMHAMMNAARLEKPSRAFALPDDPFPSEAADAMRIS